MENNPSILEINGNQTNFKVFTASTWFKRLRGWMLKLEPLNEGLLIKPCNSVHTFFMRFAIDLVFLDNNGRVVRVVENVAPYRIILPVRNTSKTLELPLNTISKLGIKTGDKLEFTQLSGQPRS